MSQSSNGAHILVFPYPAQGHMLPLLDLTHQLLLRGLAITIVTTPKNLSLLSPLLAAHSSAASLRPLVLPFPPHPSLPAGVEHVRHIGNHGNLPIINALGKLYDPLAAWFKSQPSPPLAIISDFFLGWTQNLALNLGVPRIAFYSSGAFLSSILDNIWDNFNTVRSLTVVEFPELPKSPSFPKEHLPSMVRHFRESDPDWEFVRSGMIANVFSWKSVFNSFEALEGAYLQYLRKKASHGRVYAVGPLGLSGGAESVDRVDPNMESSSGVLAWLDGCPDESVLYVCFGSQKPLSKAQVEAVAAGLEQSGSRFVWVVKSGAPEPEANGFSLIPDGFEERIAGSGMVIKGWAPQVSILSHRAVGVFLSHCGWNSVLEAIAAGVTILGWPMEADQFVNAKLLVENMGAAVRACEGEDAVPDSGELARTIAESMTGNTPQKVRAKELRDEAVRAVKEGGSSYGDLDGLVKELAQLQVGKDHGSTVCSVREN